MAKQDNIEREALLKAYKKAGVEVEHSKKSNEMILLDSNNNLVKIKKRNGCYVAVATSPKKNLGKVGHSVVVRDSKTGKVIIGCNPLLQRKAPKRASELKDLGFGISYKRGLARKNFKKKV